MEGGGGVGRGEGVVEIWNLVYSSWPEWKKSNESNHSQFKTKWNTYKFQNGDEIEKKIDVEKYAQFIVYVQIKIT